MPQVYLLKIWHDSGETPRLELRHRDQGSVYFPDLEALKAYLGKQIGPTTYLAGDASPAAQPPTTQQGETP